MVSTPLDLLTKYALDSRVKDQPRDVLLGHAGQLVREHVLEADEPHQDPLVGLLVQRVTDHMELNHPPALLETGGLVACRVSRQQAGLHRSGGCKITTVAAVPQRKGASE